jgi:hypothetical protein
MQRIGVLSALAADDPEASARLTAFLQGLAQLGWIDGRNVRIEYRWGAGDARRIRRYDGHVRQCDRCAARASPRSDRTGRALAHRSLSSRRHHSAPA